MTQPLSAPRSVVWRESSGDAFALVAVVAIAVASLTVLSAFFDARLAYAARDLSPAVVTWGQLVSDIGLSGYLFALSALTAGGALLARRLLPDRRFDAALTVLAERALYIFASLAASGLAAQLIKHLVGRARPTLIDAFGPYHFDMLSMKNSLASFPSGHSATAFTMATGLGLICPRWRGALIVLATMIACSRIVVHAHYASDIVAGGALGTGAALLVARAFADRSIAFERDGGRPRLKARGVVITSLTGRPVR